MVLKIVWVKDAMVFVSKPNKCQTKQLKSHKGQVLVMHYFHCHIKQVKKALSASLSTLEYKVSSPLIFNCLERLDQNYPFLTVFRKT